MFGEVSRRVLVKVCLMLLLFPQFSDFNDLHHFLKRFFYCKLQHHGTTQDELIKHFEKVQASQMMTAQGPISCVRAFY